jgi:ribosome-associated translation inhibitor RaiA
MLKENLFLKFHGFHPTDFTRVYLEDKMSTLQEESPYGAHLTAHLSWHEHQYKGVITIHSAAGKFEAVASDKRLKDVVEKLFDQIRKQLQKWKSRRFRHESIKDRISEKEQGHDSTPVA